MKNFIPLWVSFLIIQSSLGAELPAPVQNAVNIRLAAIKKIDASFVQELSKLKTNYTKVGDLANATLVDELMKQYDQPALKIVGKWKIFDTGQPKVWSGVITISENMTYSCTGQMGVQGYHNGNISVSKNKMSLGPYEFDLATLPTGKIYATNNGDRTMELIEN